VCSSDLKREQKTPEPQPQTSEQKEKALKQLREMRHAAKRSLV